MNISANDFKTCFWPQSSKICRVLCTWGVWSNTRGSSHASCPRLKQTSTVLCLLRDFFRIFLSWSLANGRMQWMMKLWGPLSESLGPGETEMWEYVKEMCVYVVDWMTERRVLKMLPEYVAHAYLKYSSLSPDIRKHAKIATFYCPSESSLCHWIIFEVADAL